jgi:hypothetical protein
MPFLLAKFSEHTVSKLGMLGLIFFQFDFLAVIVY